jgi:hypothetical protein
LGRRSSWRWKGNDHRHVEFSIPAARLLTSQWSQFNQCAIQDNTELRKEEVEEEEEEEEERSGWRREGKGKEGKEGRNKEAEREREVVQHHHRVVDRSSEPNRLAAFHFLFPSPLPFLLCRFPLPTVRPFPLRLPLLWISPRFVACPYSSSARDQQHCRWY